MLKKALTHKFVEFIPTYLDEGTIYVSLDYATVAHKCCCGCGNEVVTPLSPTDWRLTFDGQSISLWPSIGNWNFTCQSHYWIKHNRVEWARRWSQDEIDEGRTRDSLTKESYYKNTAYETTQTNAKQSYWNRLKEWLSK